MLQLLVSVVLIMEMEISCPPKTTVNTSPSLCCRWFIDFACWPAQEAPQLLFRARKKLSCRVLDKWSFRALPTGNEGGLLMGDSVLVIQIHLCSSPFLSNSLWCGRTLSQCLATSSVKLYTWAVTGNQAEYCTFHCQAKEMSAFYVLNEHV